MEQGILNNDPLWFSSAKEGQYFDRKSARKDVNEIARHICAFANASGGKLVIGIEDDGEITGFTRDGAHPVEGFEQAAITDCEPVPEVVPTVVPVANSHGERDAILVLDVRASTDRVIARRKDREVFLRQGDKSVRLQRDQVTALEYDKHQRNFEDEVVDRSSLDDLDPEVMARYKAELGTTAPNDWVLRSRGFLVDGHLTSAGVLLFCDNPTRFIPCARVRVLRYDGSKMRTGSRLNIVKDRAFDGPIPKVVEGAKEFIASQLREFQFLGADGRFKVIPEYPEFAWFEGLVNAITHRNYGLSGDYIRVSMYDDRMEIHSPGKLPNIVTLENMRYTRYSRNPKIARTLVEFGWVRELNEGVNRIYDEMQQVFLNEPRFSEPNDAAVLLTLENSATSRVLRQGDALESRVDEDTLETLNEYEIVILQMALSKDRLTTREVARQIGKGNSFVGRTLRGLAGKGLLEWHGANPNDPRQYYTYPQQKAVLRTE